MHTQSITCPHPKSRPETRVCRSCFIRPLAERFWPKVNKTPVCWIWMGGKSGHGYGVIGGEGGRAGKQLMAHRVAYELLRGPIPEGLVIDHLCRNPPCVNPAHLEVVTYSENYRRGMRRLATTHCPKGHPYDEVNTRFYRGHRYCRACHRAEWQAKPHVVYQCRQCQGRWRSWLPHPPKRCSLCRHRRWQ